jgi:hypothetical protein
MNIAALSSQASALQMMRPSEASEGPGPDHDGDADDKGVSGATSVPSQPPAGMGTAVDIKA